VLLATGLLIQSPDWRARLLGGYGRELADLHEWAGALFVAIPLAALLRTGRPLLRDAQRRLGPPGPAVDWTKLHIGVSLVGGVLLGATGIVLWLDRAFPLVVADWALEIHVVLSTVFLATLPLHLVAARRKIASKLRGRAVGPTSGDGDPLETASEQDPAPPRV